MRAQTSIEYLLLTAGVILIAVATGAYVYVSGQQTLQAIQSVPETNAPLVPSATTDTISPTCSLSYTPSTPTNLDSIIVTVSATDNKALFGADVYVDGTYKSSCVLSGASDSCSTEIGKLPPGSHIISANVFDAAGNKGSCSKSVYVKFVDTTPPSITFTASPSTITLGDSVTLSCSASDPSGIQSIQITSGSSVLKTCSSSPCTTTDTPSSAGTKTYTCTATDTAGNSASKTATVTVNPPSTSAEICNNGIDDDGDGLVDCDDPDCASDPACTTNSPPSVTLTAYPSTIVLGQSVNLTCSASDSDGLQYISIYYSGTLLRSCSFSGATSGTCSTTHAPSSTGVKTYTCSAKDTLGALGSTTTTVTVISSSGTLETDCSNGIDDDGDGLVDCDDPDCAGQTGPEGVTCCQLDSHCPPDTATVSGSSCSWKDWYCDTAMHVCKYTLNTVNCDQFDVCNPPTQWADYEPTSSSCTVGCMGQGCCELMFTLVSGCTVWSAGFGQMTLSECASASSVDCGPYRCYYYNGWKIGTPPATETSCSDGHDNDCDGVTDCADSDCSSDPACSTPPSDTTPPSVSVTSPASTSFTAGQSITISCSATDNVKVSTITVKFDGATKNSCTINSTSGSCSASVTLTKGSHTITCTATDSSGNTGSASKTITVSCLSTACTIGACKYVECATQGTYQLYVCTDTNNDGCGEWVAQGSCTSTLNDACTIYCTDECSYGQTKYTWLGDDLYKCSCGNYDADNCYEWPTVYQISSSCTKECSVECSPVGAQTSTCGWDSSCPRGFRYRYVVKECKESSTCYNGKCCTYWDVISSSCGSACPD